MPRLLSICYNSRLQVSLIQKEFYRPDDTSSPMLLGITGQHFNPAAGRVVQKTNFEPKEVECVCELLAFGLHEAGLEVPESMRQLLEQAKKKRPHRIIEK